METVRPVFAVKNTFITYADDDKSPERMVRASSDPGLAQTAEAALRDYEACEEGLEVTMSGFDDGDVVTDDEAPFHHRPLQCYSHIKELHVGMEEARTLARNEDSDSVQSTGDEISPYPLDCYRHLPGTRRSSEAGSSGGATTMGSRGEASSFAGSYASNDRSSPSKETVEKSSREKAAGRAAPDTTEACTARAAGDTLEEPSLPADTASPMSGSCGLRRSCEGPARHVTPEKPPAKKPSPSRSGKDAEVQDETLLAEHRRLQAENARLAEENKKLMQQCLSAANAAAAASVACGAAMNTASSSSSTMTPMPNGTVMPNAATMPPTAASMPAAMQTAAAAAQMGQMLCFVPWFTQGDGTAMPAFAVFPQMAMQPNAHSQQLQQTPTPQPQAFPEAVAPAPAKPQKTPNAATVVASDAVDTSAGDNGSLNNDSDVAADAESESTEPLATPDNERTTVMLRNLPNNYSFAMLKAMIDGEGFHGLYDFVYLPMDFTTRACLGYCFVNLVSHDVALRFWDTFQGYSKWSIPSRKLCNVSWSNPHQGYLANIERYRNSPVMHAAVPPEYKPQVFNSTGDLMSFPTPTKKLRAPRVREAYGGGRPGRKIYRSLPMPGTGC
eukprot:TRINITY_DN12005_c1_g1_i2.p1 TRINITY_DN12005_c1_g1~~TRINITY_DN12005_c1_g1_i2.p1  ORF type:complete len:614 (+),score=149.44 TRINITY_DN12005_c1_g1_i2:125-1966(+)